MAADTHIVNLTDGTNEIDILIVKLEHDYDKQLVQLSVPRSTDPSNTAPETTGTLNPLNLNVDLQRLKQVITVTGYLLEDTGDTALNKKDALEIILSNSGLLTLSWKIGTTTISKYGNIIKTKVSEVAERIGDLHPTTQAKSLMIQLQFAVGQHKG